MEANSHDIATKRLTELEKHVFTHILLGVATHWDLKDSPVVLLADRILERLCNSSDLSQKLLCSRHRYPDKLSLVSLQFHRFLSNLTSII